MEEEVEVEEEEEEPEETTTFRPPFEPTIPTTQPTTTSTTRVTTTTPAPTTTTTSSTTTRTPFQLTPLPTRPTTSRPYVSTSNFRPTSISTDSDAQGPVGTAVKSSVSVVSTSESIYDINDKLDKIASNLDLHFHAQQEQVNFLLSPEPYLSSIMLAIRYYFVLVCLFHIIKFVC